MSLAVVKPTPPASAMSPARASLADHLNKVREAAAELASARAPWSRLRSTLEAAQADHRAALAVLAAIAAKESGDLATWARSGTGPRPIPRDAERRTAQEAIDVAARAVAALEGAVAETQTSMTAAASRAAELEAATDRRVITVLAEEHALTVAEEREAARRFATAQEASRALRVFTGEFARRLGTDGARIWEAMGVAWQQGLRDTLADPPPDWAGLAARLATDAGATIEGCG